MLHRYVSYGLGLVLGCCLVLLLRAQRAAEPLGPDTVQQRWVLKALSSPVPVDPSKSYFYRESPAKLAAACVAGLGQTALPAAVCRELVLEYPWPWGPLKVEETLDPKAYRVLTRDLTLAGYLWLVEPTAAQLAHLPPGVCPVHELPAALGECASAPGQALPPAAQQPLQVQPPSRPAVLLRLPSIALPSHALYTQALLQATEATGATHEPGPGASIVEPVRVAVPKPR
jgi:hypothetical protein